MRGIEQQDLPIREVIPALKTALADHDEVVLEAPPGAGKTTYVPLVLLDEAWLAGKRIIMLEPRRIAARTAAYYMAEQLGEAAGDTVGYRMRLDTRVSKSTRIEVVTEGVFTRMLQSDPALEGVGLVIFDEFHERSLDSDLGLALALQARELFAEDSPVKLLIMSATLNGESLKALLPDAPVITSQGRQFDVAIHHGKAMMPRQRIEDRVVPQVKEALIDHPDSSLLVFLPGQGEIRRCLEQLENISPGVEVMPLFGGLTLDEQRKAIQPAITGRKVVLATNIAETSLTIEGVDVVVDAGLERVPAFEAKTGMTRLTTQRISQASATQRAGRAGRLRPGHCYRLWSKDQQYQLATHIAPEILEADLAPMALQLVQWGVADPAELNWLDAPPTGHYQQAISLLRQLNAIEASALKLTYYGELMARLNLHPRLAHMLLCAEEVGQAEAGALLAAVLSDRDPIERDNPDMLYRLELLLGRVSCPANLRGWKQRTLRQADDYLSRLSRLARPELGDRYQMDDEVMPGYLLASAYPDRIARRRHKGGYQLANGRSAAFAERHRLEKSSWLAVASVGGMAKRRGDMILSAAVLDKSLFDSLLAHLVQEHSSADWDEKAQRFIAESRRSIGGLLLATQPMDVTDDDRLKLLLQLVKDKGISWLPWTDEARSLQARTLLAREYLQGEWPDLADESLLQSLEDWLAPYLNVIRKLTDFKRLNMLDMLMAQLSWDKQQLLDKHLPLRWQTPSGNRYRIDYSVSPPVLAVKLQEMFGVLETPVILEGQLQLMIHLLSPAGRPLQITQDLKSFWENGYDQVRREMKGRYPKHAWPENPL